MKICIPENDDPELSTISGLRTLENRTRPANLLKKETLAQVFPVNFVKFLRIPFVKEHLWCMLLL